MDKVDVEKRLEEFRKAESMNEQYKMMLLPEFLDGSFNMPMVDREVSRLSSIVPGFAVASGCVTCIGLDIVCSRMGSLFESARGEGDNGESSGNPLTDLLRTAGQMPVKKVGGIGGMAMSMSKILISNVMPGLSGRESEEHLSHLVGMVETEEGRDVTLRVSMQGLWFLALMLQSIEIEVKEDVGRAAFRSTPDKVVDSSCLEGRLDVENYIPVLFGLGILGACYNGYESTALEMMTADSGGADSQGPRYSEVSSELLGNLADLYLIWKTAEPGDESGDEPAAQYLLSKIINQRSNADEDQEFGFGEKLSALSEMVSVLGVRIAHEMIHESPLGEPRSVANVEEKVRKQREEWDEKNPLAWGDA